MQASAMDSASLKNRSFLWLYQALEAAKKHNQNYKYIISHSNDGLFWRVQFSPNNNRKDFYLFIDNKLKYIPPGKIDFLIKVEKSIMEDVEIDSPRLPSSNTGGVVTTKIVHNA